MFQSQVTSALIHILAQFWCLFFVQTWIYGPFLLIFFFYLNVQIQYYSTLYLNFQEFMELVFRFPRSKIFPGSVVFIVTKSLSFL